VSTNDIPAFDYEAAKDFYFDKLQADRTGKGRMESALFHTAQFIFDKGCQRQAALLARIVELEARLDHLRWQASVDAAECRRHYVARAALEGRVRLLEQALAENPKPVGITAFNPLNAASNAPNMLRPTPPLGYTAEELELDNPHNAWMHE
jgi:hypothetical protein